MPLSLHTQAPPFVLPSTAGKSLSLEEDFAGQPVVLFFYPKDFTHGCTAEACGFRDAYDELKTLGVALLGISRDSIELHNSFIAAKKLPYTLLSDRDGAVSKAYKALLPLVGLPARITYVLGPDHRVAFVVNNLLQANTHPEAVLAFLRKGQPVLAH